MRQCNNDETKPAAGPKLWPLWSIALSLATAEWLLPLRWSSHGLLTAGSVLLSVIWLLRMGCLLWAVGTPKGPVVVVRRWSITALGSLWVLHLGVQASKAWLLRDLFRQLQAIELLQAYRSFVFVGLVITGLALSLRPNPLQRLLLAVADHTARLVALSFGGAILFGAFLLLLPWSVRNTADISVVNALFMSASAVCVTGLAVTHVATTYTLFGQAVLLALVQIGGLGIMVIYGAIVALAGHRMSTRNARLMSEVIDVTSVAAVRRLVWGIVLFTVVVEAIGTIGLHVALLRFPDVPMGPDANLPRAGAGDRWWAALFLAVSAYCNAGFCLFRDGMVPFAGDWWVSGLVMFLIVAGGLGFPVWFELLGRIWARLRRHRPERLSLHSRTVLLVTGLLLGFGTVMYLLLEWSRSMKDLPLNTKLLTAAFQSVVTRTAGFNSLDYAQMATATWLFTCVLMFIGASPGSTGGGIKTTTFAVLVAATWADLRARGRIELWQRSISDAAARRAVGVTLVSGAVVVLMTFLLLLVEPFEPLRLGFEAVSALATVGLSTGITPDLGNAGKLIITASMYLGRIGPLTLAMALASTSVSHSLSLPEERLGIG